MAFIGCCLRGGGSDVEGEGAEIGRACLSNFNVGGTVELT